MHSQNKVDTSLNFLDKIKLNINKYSKIIIALSLVGILASYAIYYYFDNKDIVNPYQTYSYKILSNDLEKISKKYPSIVKVSSLGKSEYGREIWAVALGRGETTVLFTGAHHAREWMTATMCSKMIEEYARAYTKGESIEGISVVDVLDKTTIWFVPMVNPDGVTLQQGDLEEFPENVQKELIAYNGGSRNFETWKADALGIDLNRQYDLNWGNNSHVVWERAPDRYQGEYAHQAKEVIATVELIEKIKPEILMAYHSSGEVIFWTGEMLQENFARDYNFTRLIGDITGYELVPDVSYFSPPHIRSAGTMAPWFRSKYAKPALTMEIGEFNDDKELPLEQWDGVWAKNKTIGLITAMEGNKLWLQEQ